MNVGRFPLDFLHDFVLRDLDFKDVFVLLVGQSRVLEVCEAEEVGEDEESKDDRIISGFETIVYDGQSC